MLNAHGLDASLGNSYRADGLDVPAKQMGEASGCAGGAGRLGVAPPLGEPSTHFLRRDRDQMRGVNPARGRGLLDAWRECFGSLLNSDMAARQLLGFLAPAPAFGCLPIGTGPPVGGWPER